MKRPRIRQKRALAAANRRAWFQLAIGAGVALALFAIVLSIPPRISPEALAAAVKAQTVHKSGAECPTESTERLRVSRSPAAPRLEQTAGTRATNQAVLATKPTPRYWPTDFGKLSGFPFWVTDQMVDRKENAQAASLKTMAQIPEGVKTLNGKEVSLRGFMLPMKYEGKLTTEFLLLKNQSLCCYGVPPKITEWVNVRMAGKGLKPIMDEPVTVCGVFHVGEVRENGELVGIYRLDADKVKGPRE